MNEYEQKPDSAFRASYGFLYGSIASAYLWVAILILVGWLF